MRLLYVGEAILGSRSLQRFNSLKLLNPDTILFLYQNDSGGINGGASLISRIMNKIGMPLEYRKVNKRLMRVIEKYRHHTVLFEKCLSLKPALYRYLEENGVNVVGLFEDDICLRHNTSIYLNSSLKYFDYIFTTKEKNIGAEFSERYFVGKDFLIEPTFCNLIYKFDPDAIKRKKTYRYDISFIGTYERERADYIEYLARHGYKVYIWGNGWKATRHSNIAINEAAYDENYISIAMDSKINLCFLRKKNRDTITSRSIEIPAAGGFMLAQDTERHRNLLGEKVCGFFDSKKSLLKQVDCFLKNEDLRRSVAENGYRHIHSSGLSHSDLFAFISKKINEN